MRLTAEWLEALVEATKGRMQVGMVASKIRFMDRPTVLNSTGFNVLRDGAAIDRGRGEIDEEQYDTQLDVFGASAGAALYRRLLLEDVGLFDEDYFAYYEDVDIAWRARLRKWICRYAPEALAYHKHSASTSPYSDFKVFHGERNRIWNVVKGFPLPQLLLAFPYGWLKNLALLAASIRRKGRAMGYLQELTMWGITKTMARANIAALSGLRHVLRKRRHIQNISKLDWRDVERLFLEYAYNFEDLPYL
jgi:GT2 family glycosyltransferase